jgi:hypothetical protein
MFHLLARVLVTLGLDQLACLDVEAMKHNHARSSTAFEVPTLDLNHSFLKKCL